MNSPKQSSGDGRAGDGRAGDGRLQKTPLSARCPVPAEQIPIKEYESMSASWFYSWGARDLRGYLGPIISLWLLSWVVVGPMAAVSFVPAKLPPQFIISASLGALLLPTLALIQLYIGWRHVCDRLSQKAVPYEESGWYDGQIWEKPDDVINRDRLIADYQVKPLLLRLQKTFATILGMIAFCLVTWQFL
ncbi:MAG: CGLD27 family protein [Phormidesmis sp. RL_2_1]|nr:CGLD27 family protein [Phormidesmis sp. RL_2_1]